MINFLPKKRRKKKARRLVILIIIIILSAGLYYFYSLNIPNSSSSQIETFVIKPGWGTIKISQELARAGLIRNILVFQLHSLFQGISGRLQDGEYFFSKNLSIKEIAQILSRGAGATREITLTFIEGWNNQEFAEYLEKKGIARPDDFFAVIKKKADWWDNYEFLNDKPGNLDLEGYLFPDTYRVFRDASISDIVKKILDNFNQKLTSELRFEIKSQGKNIHQILTLASILEKEVSTDQDRKLVAGIFYKRLELGMPLQADSTVNYVTGKDSSRASAKDLEIDSPYNTYKYRGLPPGPISNPGISSILAAIYPSSNNYLYFLTTPDGQVIYNETHDQHVIDKAKYYR